MFNYQRATDLGIKNLDQKQKTASLTTKIGDSEATVQLRRSEFRPLSLGQLESLVSVGALRL